MQIGVDYYPEQWQPQYWQKDIDLMAETGVQVVRLAEFAWAVLEPQEDEFCFEWLDAVIAMLAEKKIGIVLGTPTNCPPLWLYERYPDAVQTDADGHSISIGIRGHRCYNSPNFRRRAEIIIEEMLRHYKDNPHIIAWQIDNELEANFCRCAHCSASFRAFLQEKYVTLDVLNRRYGNAVWSGCYSAWSQVVPPMGTHPKAWYNPSLMLDYHRFAAMDAQRFVQFQVDVIRRHCPTIPITTNTWFCENHVDFHALFHDLDFVSYDNYPTTSIPENSDEIYSHAFHLDFMRGIKQKNFWIMEQLSGGMGCWMPMKNTPLPGMIAGYALQAFAHGADIVVHFRWRSAIQGAEMFWHGLIDHSGKPGRRFTEFRQLCARAAELREISGAAYMAETALLYDIDTDFALNIQPQSDGFDYIHQLKLWHDACTRYGAGVDILPMNADISGYRMMIVPALYITHPEMAEKLYAYVKDGGTLILTARSGVKDIDNGCIMEALPTIYRELIGAEVEEYDPIGWAQTSVKMDGIQYTASHWCDVLMPSAAEIIASYGSGFYSGRAAVTKNRYGSGSAWYVGTVPSRTFCHALMKKMRMQCGLSCLDLPAEIEVTSRRMSEEMVYRFIFNHTDKVQTFALDGKMYSLQAFEMVTEKKFF